MKTGKEDGGESERREGVFMNDVESVGDASVGYRVTGEEVSGQCVFTVGSGAESTHRL